MMKKSSFFLKNLPNSSLEWKNPWPVWDENDQNRHYISEQNVFKNLLPFEAGHDYIVDVRQSTPLPRAESEGSTTSKYISKCVVSGNWADQYAQSKAFAQISPHPGTPHAQHIKIPAF